jgi:leader peptidase (prepilin peptidase)/N-methyltransferase
MSAGHRWPGPLALGDPTVDDAVDSADVVPMRAGCPQPAPYPWYRPADRPSLGGVTPLPTITAPPGGPGGAVVAGLLALAGVPAGAAARALLGRLRRGARVPPPWCEAGVAAVWSVTGAGVGAALVPVRWLPVLLGLGWFAVAAAAVDLRHHRLPDALTLPALPLALALLVPLGSAAVLRGLAGAAVAVAAHAALHLAAPAALGAGDVKLAAPLGSVLAAGSWSALVLAGLLAAVLSGGLAVVVLLRRERAGALPHGPSMLVAAWLVATAAAAGAGGGT